MNVPEGLRYSSDHEWVAVDGNIARVGITDYAQDALGDVVYVDLPDGGTTVSATESFGEVESTKSVSELYAPVSGEVIEVNSQLTDTPEKLNDDAYGDGWLIAIEMSDPSELDALLDAGAYTSLIEG
ncbi:MAG: glycine cleavage system protein GcvH [Acidimicrobiales bacterium]